MALWNLAESFLEKMVIGESSFGKTMKRSNRIEIKLTHNTLQESLIT
jgi:hypothetical protein